jgi:hypothetical protein
MAIQHAESGAVKAGIWMHRHRSIVTLLNIAFTLAMLIEAKAEETPFPLVMRIDKSVLALLNTEVDERRPIDRVVLGTHAVGESRTRGEIRAALNPPRKPRSKSAFEGVPPRRPSEFKSRP